MLTYPLMIDTNFILFYVGDTTSFIVDSIIDWTIKTSDLSKKMSGITLTPSIFTLNAYYLESYRFVPSVLLP